MTTETPPSQSPTIESWSFDAEEFRYESLGELIDNHQGELSVGQEVWFGKAKRPAMSRLVSADFVIENISERAYDVGDEFADGYPDVTPEHKAKLQALLEGWLAECPAPKFWEVVDVQSYTITEDDLK